MNKLYPIADGHCDLLSYLQYFPNSNAHQPQVRCSLPQLKAGNVKLQTLAIFTQTDDKNSSADGVKQSEVFKQLLDNEQDYIYHLQTQEQLLQVASNEKTAVIVAIENASGFCSEKDSFAQGIENFENILKNVGKPFYISLTHNLENRFGGGNMSNIGLKDDGRRLLEYLSGKKIAVDMSHTCDELGFGILNFIDKNNLNIPIIASHSNFRTLKNDMRNITDELAQEVWRRNGIIGLNWLRKFLGDDISAFFKHLEYGLKIGNAKQICLGTDFFYYNPAKVQGLPLFFEGYDNASCYPKFMQELENQHLLNDSELEDFAYQNLLRYLSQLWQ